MCQIQSRFSGFPYVLYAHAALDLQYKELDTFILLTIMESGIIYIRLYIRLDIIQMDKPGSQPSRNWTGQRQRKL